MNAGTLRHKVDIQTKTVTKDAFGNSVTAWVTTYASVPASVEPYQSKEVYAGQQVQSRTFYKISLRYLPDITDQNQILWGSRKFVIGGSVNDEERNISLVLTCTEVSV